jgi:hypothetical protein
MPFEESEPQPAYIPPPFELGQEVVDRDNNRVGKIQARFSRYILVERGTIFVKTYYVPHSVVQNISKDAIVHLTLTEEDLRNKGYNEVPDDLYIESPETGVPDISGVAQFARGPLSPAETGHYNYGRHWPGMNTDASGSYHREEVMPQPQRYVQEKIFATDLPLEPRDVSPD